MDQLWLSVIRSRFGVRKSAKSFNFLQRHSSSGTQTDFNQILMSARGGSVTLHRNEELKVDIIRIANISKKNALSGQMVLQLSEITSKLEKDRMQDKRAILISGDGDSFCAGADLSLVEKNLKQAGFSDKLSEIMYDSQQRLAKLPVPSIALIDGPAFGAGAELAIGCDLRLTTPSGQLSFVHGRMGLAPALGGATRLVQLVGSARALDLLVTGRNLQGKELVDWGLASGRVIGEDEAMLWIEENLRSKCTTQMALKSVIQAASTMSYKESVIFERRVFSRQWGGLDHLEALNRYRGNTN